MLRYQREFPDFPASDMPQVPETFRDSSWHNDAMPSFTDDLAGLVLFVNYPDPAMREMKGAPRYLVGLVDDQDAVLLATEDWNEVLDYLNSAMGD